MLNSLLYYRHNSESDSYLHPHLFPRNGDHNTASKGPLCQNVGSTVECTYRHAKELHYFHDTLLYRLIQVPH